MLFDQARAFRIMAQMGIDALVAASPDNVTYLSGYWAMSHWARPGGPQAYAVLPAGGTWAGYVVAGCVIVSGLGALNGWTMICAEMPLAAAKDGLFPGLFGRLSGAGVPAAGIVVSTVFATVAMAASFAGTTGQDVFTTLLYMSGITAAIPYAFSAAAQIKWRIADKRALNGRRFARDVVVAAVALVFCVLFIWYSRNTGAETWIGEWMPFIMAGVAFLVGIPVYLRQKAHMTQPDPVPAYR